MHVRLKCSSNQMYERPKVVTRACDWKNTEEIGQIPQLII